MGKLKWRGTKGQKRSSSTIETLRKKYLRFKIISLSAIGVLAMSLFAIIFVNYDYLIFKTLISRHYIHTETLDAMFYEHLGINPNGRYHRYFDNLVISLVTAEIRKVGGDPYTFLFTPTQRAAHEERILREADGASLDEIAPGIGILTLPNISPYTEDFVRNNLSEIGAFDNLIIDLRGNPGGELASSQRIAGYFLPRRATINFEQARWDFWPFSRERRSRGSQAFDFENIVILQNARTASAAEVMIVALQGNLDNITTIGETTYGKAVGQVLIPLRRGFAVNSTAILIYTPDGNYIHGVGVVPDIASDADDMLDAALRFLQGRVD